MRRAIRHCNRLTARPSHLTAQAAVPAYIASSFVKPRAGMTDAQATAQMAEDMRQAASREGGITESDLELLGYTRAQIRIIVPGARRLAQALAVVAP